MTKTQENIYTDNYYYVQVFTNDKDGGLVTLRTICFANTVTQAKELVNKWLDGKGIEGRRDINLYQKNYKRDSKKMVEGGNYITN